MFGRQRARPLHRQTIEEFSMSDERVFIGDLTRKEFRERMQAGTIKAAIVPTAATEQHNEHLHDPRYPARIVYG